MDEIRYLLDNEDLFEPGKVEEICARIHNRENQLDLHLKDLLSKQCQLESRLQNVGKSINSLTSAKNNAGTLGGMITHTSQLSENVSSKVRRLDEARSRVSECQQRVHDLIDLQLCSQGVMAAIKEENFEQAAAHISRFLSMDEGLLKKTADDVSESVTSVKIAVETLHTATGKLRGLLAVKFEEAVRKDDAASVERFFKLYPSVGQKEEGVRQFTQFIAGRLQQQAQRELRNSMEVAKAEKRTHVAFSDTLTILLEHICRVVEVNQPILEACYGNGHLLEMARILQLECDQEVRQCVLEFSKSRQIQRRVTQINEYLKSGGNSSSTGARRSHQRNASSGSSIEKLNAKDIDSLINEVTLLHSRAEMYTKFIRRRVMNDLQQSQLSGEERGEKEKQLNEMLQRSETNRQMQELLSIYLLLERYFMEESVLKAIALDSHEARQLTSSMVDDVFFIVRKCIRRSTNTQSLDGVCAVINNAAACFENDFLSALKGPLKAGYPSGYIDLAQAYSAIQISIQQGKLQTSDTEVAKTQFLVRLNNTDQCTEYVDTLVAMMGHEIPMVFQGMTPLEREKLESCVSGVRAVGDSLKATIDFGMQQLRSSALKPRLHGWVDDFLNYGHSLSEEELAAYEAGETFMQKLVIELDGLLNSFKETLCGRNYEILVGMVATDVTVRLERVVKKTTFNRLGGLILEQEVRALGSYLTSATSWSVRDKLARLNQIATVLNLERVSELTDFYNPSDSGGAAASATAWRLTPNEIRKLLSLRIDFKVEDIKRLKI